VRANDPAATRAYLHASEVYAQGARAETNASAVAIEARASRIANECPSALVYAPRDAAFEGLGEETVSSLFYAGVAPFRSETLKLAKAIGHLAWSDRRLTRLVRSQAAEERAIAMLALPDVCADIAAWKASAYAALPASARRFLASVAALEAGSTIGPSEESREAAIMRLLGRYEGPAQRRTARTIERLQARAGRRVMAAVALARVKLAAALGVSAL
jgi:hypothetical protein